MSYYIYNSATTAYLFDGSCNNGFSTPNNTNRTNLFLINGKWVKGSIQNIGNSNTTYHCFPGDPTDGYAFDFNALILPSVIIVGALAVIIRRWIVRRYY